MGSCRAGRMLVLMCAAGLGLGAIADAGAQRRPARTTAVPQVDWLALQVGLDRAGFSPGEIDGRDGRNTRNALAAYAHEQRLPDGGADPRALVERFDASAPSTIEYAIPGEDAARQWTPPIPADLVEQGQLTTLGYTSLVELLSERFHVNPAVLKRLNPKAGFAAGETIHVPNVEPMVLPPTSGQRKEPPGARAAQVVVDKATSALSAVDAQGRTVLHAPVTTGSEHDPLPIGDWTVLGVFLQPKFFYNPDLFWDADPSHARTEIAAGPNNPVGVVWIDIDKEHYGLHGTPEPSTIGHRASHGCIRLTNWDALRVAASVDKGTAVKFQ